MGTYLPNIILVKIFEYRIDIKCSLDNYYQLIKIFVLVSKRIQLEVLPKVRYSYRFTIACSKPKEIILLKNLNKLTDFCNLQYSMKLPHSEINSFVNSDFGDQIYKRITHLDIRIGEKYKMNQEILDKFVNLQNSCFSISAQPKDISVIHHEVPYDKFKVNEIYLVEPTLNIDNNIFHLLFNSNSISHIFIYDMYFSIPKSFQLDSSSIRGNLLLTELRLLKTNILPIDIALLISKSPSLQLLILFRVLLRGRDPTPIFDAVIQLQNLQRFDFTFTNLQVKDTIYLLNNIKCHDVMFNIEYPRLHHQ
ncbi:hypothetical protein DLAC_09120 [Tieghemostelium lacteum]|uniref:Uncharacterized protein n=1 Tax=Tieghemostelium lacteum TaxID=361077 RepID=A0A151Z9F1_TIELA|nr:hypothetical protein DLAC_09120 [Tieghemostelium lacteum]|eukprot:KYQ90494.1 hypothetical protein DLAC_09120 [Tieghemostelium lacteum]